MASASGTRFHRSTEVQSAIMVRHKLRQQKMDLLGLAAPKRSVHARIDLDGENESLQAQLAEAYSASLAEKERELADLRAKLANVHDPGPPTLAVLAGRAEQL